MNPPRVSRVGPTWSFTFDASHAPQYAYFVVRGQPTAERIAQMTEVLEPYYPQLSLPNGKLCPLIMDRRLDHVPDPGMIQYWHAAVEPHQTGLSAIIHVIDPTRPDRALMELSLEISGQFLLPRAVIVTSWRAALAEVERVHRLG